MFEFITIHWVQDHLLVIAAIGLTLVFLYLYLIERDTGVKLSKRYRNSIFEAQSKVFLNATQYLISGDKNLAIREFLNAVDINRETVETYFALGGLFRSNGEIEKAISIHRSLIARENISESTRLKALKELAVDFDKGGFVDKAIETYKDVLKINRDQVEVVQSLCRIYEDIEDWSQAYNYRLMLSKISHENQGETISHILVQKAKHYFESGEFTKCNEDLEEAFRFAPSVSAKMLKLRLLISSGDLEGSKSLFFELLKEHPMYTSFIFLTMEEQFGGSESKVADYKEKLEILKDHFLLLDDQELMSSPSVVLAKIRLLKQRGDVAQAYETLKDFVDKGQSLSDVLKAEYIKLLIELGKNSEAINQTKFFMENVNQSLTRHYCRECGYNSDQIFWRCPQCHQWETIQFRWKV